MLNMTALPTIFCGRKEVGSFFFRDSIVAEESWHVLIQLELSAFHHSNFLFASAK